LYGVKAKSRQYCGARAAAFPRSCGAAETAPLPGAEYGDFVNIFRYLPFIRGRRPGGLSRAGRRKIGASPGFSGDF